MKHLSLYSVGLAVLILVKSDPILAAVKAPPLPPGSAKVKLHPGQNPKELLRDKHAHKRPKKDKKRDDTLPVVASPPATGATK